MSEQNCIQITTAHRRRQVEWEKIIYIASHERKSNLHMADGETIPTNLSIRKLMQMLPQDGFVTINKGVLISLRHLRDVQELDYHMSDGTVLRARVKTSNQLQWNMRMHTAENRYRAQIDLYGAIEGVQAFALFAMRQEGVSLIYAGEQWQKRCGAELVVNAFGNQTHQALICIRDTLNDAQVRFIRMPVGAACFFRAEAHTCMCVIFEP